MLSLGLCNPPPSRLASSVSGCPKGTSHEQPMGQSRKPQQSVSTTSPGVSGGSSDGSWELSPSSSRPLSTSSADLTSTARDATQQLPLSPPLQLATAPTRRPLAAWAPLAFAEADLSVPTELLLKSEVCGRVEEVAPRQDFCFQRRCRRPLVLQMSIMAFIHRHLVSVGYCSALVVPLSSFYWDTSSVPPIHLQTRVNYLYALCALVVFFPP